MNRESAAPNTEAAILARLIQARQGDLSPGAAEYLLSVRFDDRDVERMNALSELAREGKLSLEEEAELDSYIHVGNLLAILQSMARRSLRLPDQASMP